MKILKYMMNFKSSLDDIQIYQLQAGSSLIF